MLNTHQSKDEGLAGRAMGLIIGGAFALAGLVALFVCLLNLSVGSQFTGVMAGAMTIGFGGYGSDRIFRAVNGATAVDAFRAAVGLVFSVVVFAAIVLNALMIATGRSEAPGALAIATGVVLLPLSAAAAWRCAKAIGLVDGSTQQDASAA